MYFLYCFSFVATCECYSSCGCLLFRQVLPRLGAEIVPQVSGKLGSRVAARFVREVLLGPDVVDADGGAAMPRRAQPWDLQQSVARSR